MNGIDIGLPTVFLGGLLSFVSPCVLPLVPPYLAFLAASTVDQIAGEERTDRALERRVFLYAFVFVLGLASVFVALGASASALGSLIASHRILFSQIAGAVIILFGLHFVGVFRIPFLYREMRFESRRLTGSLPGSYVMGLAFAFGWTPCIGPILATVLFWAAQEDTIARGTLLLAVYAAGLGVPFLLAAFFVRPFMRFSARIRRHLRKIEIGMGVFLILVGITFLTGAFESSAYWLLETFPALGRIG